MWALDIDVHFAVFDFDGIRLHLQICMTHGCPGLGIILPSVPGADYFTVFNHTLTQRAALMQALVIHGSELTPYVDDADH